VNKDFDISTSIELVQVPARLKRS